MTRAEIEVSFADGWRVDSIEPARFDLTEGAAAIFGDPAAEAWLARITRV